ncbi:Bbp19 family protein [Paraburkholderia sediminicola]|uniref:Bbp19 family protein n=1 Tax=Paraburkholderia sediminicola TaxID=458836 RepID=UPI0038B786CA
MKNRESISPTEHDDLAAAGEFNAGDANQVAERKSKAQRIDERRRNGLRQIMASSDGRAWMWALLGDCGIFRSCFTGNSQTFFNEGKREVGLPIMAELTEHFPDEYLVMAKEAKQNV